MPGKILDRLSLCHGTLISVPPPEFVSAAAEAGFGRISLRIFSPRQEGVPDHVMGYFPMLGDTPMRRETRRRLDDTGLSVIEAEAALVRPDSEISSFRPLAETAAYLGARSILTVFFGQESETQIADQYGALCELMNKYKLRCWAEFMPISALKTLEAAACVMARADAKNGGIICDSLHLIRSGGKPADLDRINSRFIQTAQISDGPLDFPLDQQKLWIETVMERRFLGEGELPVREFVDHLPDGVPISLEILSREFQERGWTATELARFCMANVRRYFDLPA